MVPTLSLPFTAPQTQAHLEKAHFFLVRENYPFFPDEREGKF